MSRMLQALKGISLHQSIQTVQAEADLWHELLIGLLGGILIPPTLTVVADYQEKISLPTIYYFKHSFFQLLNVACGNPSNLEALETLLPVSFKAFTIRSFLT